MEGGKKLTADFSPTPAHSPDVYAGNRFFGWIMPTLRTSEFTVLQTVGLDAAVVSFPFPFSLVIMKLTRSF
jgi:hypothetical protein